MTFAQRSMVSVLLVSEHTKLLYPMKHLYLFLSCTANKQQLKKDIEAESTEATVTANTQQSWHLLVQVFEEPFEI